MTSPLSAGPGTGRARGAITIAAGGYAADAHARIGAGRNFFSILGPDGVAGREAQSRVRAAVLSSWLPWPGQAIRVELRPVSLPGHRAGLDLAIAVAVLAAAGTVPAGAAGDCAFAAALGPDGSLRPAPGIRAALLAAAASGCTWAVVAPGDADAATIPGMTVVACRSLRSVLARLREPVCGPPGGLAAAPGHPDRP